MPPVVQLNESSYNFTTGDTAVFTCDVIQGTPTPQVSWLRYGNFIIVNSKYNINGNTLTINGIQKDDEGVFTCLGHNMDFGLNHTANVTVDNVWGKKC